MALGQVFSEYFGFPFQYSFHQIIHTHLSSGAGTLGQLVADVPSGLSLTPSKDRADKKPADHVPINIDPKQHRLTEKCSI
jgi:hypothetical protein